MDATKIKFRAVYDYDDEYDTVYIINFYSALEKYEYIRAKAKAFVKTTKPELSIPLCIFCDVIFHYQNIIKDALKKGVVNARKNKSSGKTLEWIDGVIQNHPLFKPCVLETWLGYKTYEIEMVSNISNLNGITFLANKNQLEKELINCFNTKYALLLWIPPLEQQTNAILQTMIDYVCTCKMGELVEMNGAAEEEDDKIPWHKDQNKWNAVFGKVRELVSHVDRNKKPKYRTFVVVGDGLDCHFSIYKDGNLLKDKLDRLPNRPTGLRTLDSLPSEIVLKWDYLYVGYPDCHFVVQYLPIGSTLDVPWTQLRTPKPGETCTIIKTERPLHIRVVADTLFGSSEFSDVLYAEPKNGILG